MNSRAFIVRRILGLNSLDPQSSTCTSDLASGFSSRNECVVDADSFHLNHDSNFSAVFFQLNKKELHSDSELLSALRMKRNHN